MLNHIFSHLAPSCLAASAAVSLRFNELITSPHAWRAAFLRYFPGQDHRLGRQNKFPRNHPGLLTKNRSFTRLTTYATWKSEYVFRTRLLSCIRRVKRHKRFLLSDRPRLYTQPGILYDSELSTAITHMHALFGSEFDQKALSFTHASAYTGTLSRSNPLSGEIESSNCSEPLSTLTEFNMRFPGIEMYGMGLSAIVGNPNVMDVSSMYGMVVGEGFPGGEIYHRSPHNKHVTTFSNADLSYAPQLGIPRMSIVSETISSIWISKTSNVPSISGGMVVMMSGSSAGILSTYGLQRKSLHRNSRAAYEITSRCVLSPGVPIVAIEADEHFTPSRLTQNRIWAIALNALGEVFYLTKFPMRHVHVQVHASTQTQEDAWLNGRTVQWNLVEPSRRVANYDSSLEVDKSYSPRSSWDGMCLNKRQLVAECHEIEQFLSKIPADFRRDCLGWNMKRTVLVDFAGNGENYAGEGIIVFNSCNELQNLSSIRKYSRRKGTQSQLRKPSSLVSFFSKVLLLANELKALSAENSNDSASFLNEDWITSTFSMGKCKTVDITATAIDISNYALATMDEDPALEPESSGVSSSSIRCISEDLQPISNLPGQRGRFVAAGTSSGTILIWDVRTPDVLATGAIQKIEPIRVIQTGSPQISALALTALYVVHGGSDGLVQAWDPLASQVEPLRTIKSRSNKAIRRDRQNLRQRINLGRRFTAVSAIQLDPDPMTLRGVAACGFNLKYWSYNDWSIGKGKDSKRKRNRPLRQTNDSFASTNKVEMKAYIISEKQEHEEDEANLRKEKNRLMNRFGTDLGSEEEMLAYATMLSRETLPQSSLPNQSDDEIANATYFDNWSGTSTSFVDSSEINDNLSNGNGDDDDLAIAIQRSLLLEDSPPTMVTRNNGFSNSNLTPSANNASAYSSTFDSQSNQSSGNVTSPQDISETEQAEIDLVLQLSLNEL